MPARVSHPTMFVMLTCCLAAAGTRTATAQELCPKAAAVRAAGEVAVPGLDARFPTGPQTVTVEADLRAFVGMRPGGTWRMPVSGGPASDGLALEGVSITRNREPQLGSSFHTFDVVVDLRAWDAVVTELELVVVDGARGLRLGAFKDVNVDCKATSLSRTFSITDHDFASFFAEGKAPTLRVKRTTFAGGC